MGQTAKLEPNVRLQGLNFGGKISRDVYLLGKLPGFLPFHPPPFFKFKPEQHKSHKMTKSRINTPPPPSPPLIELVLWCKHNKK